MHLSDTVLKEVKDLNDLGILTDNALSFISHSDMITAKVNRMLGLIKITCMDLKDESTQETLHCSHVRLSLLGGLMSVHQEIRKQTWHNSA